MKVAAVEMKLPEFAPHFLHQLGTGLSRACQQVEEQQVHKGAIARRQVRRQSHTSAFLTTDQHLLGQHQFSDVLEPDWAFMTNEAQLLCDSRHDLALRKGSNNRTAPAFVSISVKEQQRENLERI